MNNNNFQQFITTSNGKWAIGCFLTIGSVLSGRKIYNLGRLHQLQQQVNNLDKNVALMIKEQQHTNIRLNDNMLYIQKQFEKCDQQFQRFDQQFQRVDQCFDRIDSRLDQLYQLNISQKKEYTLGKLDNIRDR